MKKFIYSATTNAFYPLDMKEDYEASGSWPADGIEVSYETFIEFSSVNHRDKHRAPGEDGLPVWIATPPLTPDEQIAVANTERNRLIFMANAQINSKQWPGKAAIGRLKGEELAQYNLWLDYLDALDAVDTSAGLNTEWPERPE
ncbi:tail fiber assembly protein [Huaxiibacter chinensis]|uniref:tail fiber assembly protein n=1 Tax=Huaxiibacter chinensis TaxID=2899785 RepID=UPI003F965DC7